MAGIWSALKSESNIAEHMLTAILTFRVVGRFTPAQIKTRIESTFRQLTAEEIADIQRMATAIDAGATPLAKITTYLQICATISSFTHGSLSEAEANAIIAELAGE